MKTLLGKVSVRLITIRTMRTFAISYSPSVSPAPKIARILAVMTMPQANAIAAMTRKIVMNIPFRR